MQPTKNKVVILLSIFIFATLIRFAGINSRPIWYDEAFSILASEKGPAAILSGTLSEDNNSSAAEEHPPAYYFILWGWMQIFGSSLAAVRSLSILASLGIIVCVYQIANKLFNENTAVIAALLASLLPFQVHYAQEIRMYVFLAFWLSLATYAFLKRQWIVFSIAAALAQYSHNLAALYLIPLAFTPVFQRDWKTLRALTLAGFASIVLYLPWLIYLPAQVAKVTSNFWVEKPGFEKIFTLVLLYLPHLPLSSVQLMIGLLLATLTITLAGYQTVRSKIDSVEKQKGLWLAYLAFMPPLLLWTVSQFSPIYVERALLPSHAIFCIWIAWAFTETKLPRPIQIFAFTLVLAAAGIGIYQHVTYKGFPYGPYAALDQNIQNRFEQGDVVIHSSKLSYLPAFYFDHTLPQGFILDPVGGTTDTLSPVTRDILKLVSYESIESASANAARVWYIVYQKSIDEYASQGLNTPPEIKYLDKYFKLESSEKWDDIRLYLYVRNTP